MNKRSLLAIGTCLALGLSAAKGQYSYVTNGSTYYFTITNGTITITNFSGTGDVSIPGAISNKNVTVIGSNAFANSFLTSAVIPNNVTNIGNSAFSSCYELTNVTIPGTVTTIGPFAFIYCTSLTNVTVPSSVTNIGIGPFANCTSLDAISVNAANSAYFTAADGVLYNKNQTLLVQYPVGSTVEDYTVSNSTITIGDDSFASSLNLTNVTLGSSVTSINSSAFIYSFLPEVTIPNSVTNIGDSAFAYSFLDSVTLPTTITNLGNSVFAGTFLTDITVPGSVTHIGDSTFYNCSSLTNVILANGLTSIGTNVFNGTGLVSITIPATVTNIGDYSFAQCGSLLAVYFEGNAPKADATVFADAFDGQNDYFVSAYYQAGTTGWPAFSTNTDVPAYVWTTNSTPTIVVGSGTGFGAQSNHFGFSISWPGNPSVVVRVKTNLTQGSWIPVSTNTLTNGLGYFSEPLTRTNISRFYRVSAQ